jgi:hypothetical protein
MSDEIVSILKDIKKNQESTRFIAGNEIMVAIATAIGFIMSLALNNAFVKTFHLIPIGKKNVFGAWLYAIIAVALGILFLWLMYSKIQPLMNNEQ